MLVVHFKTAFNSFLCRSILRTCRGVAMILLCAFKNFKGFQATWQSNTTLRSVEQGKRLNKSVLKGQMPFLVLILLAFVNPKS